MPPAHRRSPSAHWDTFAVRLSREDPIAGLPAASARELMRRFRSAQPEGVISEWIEPTSAATPRSHVTSRQRACCKSMSRTSTARRGGKPPREATHSLKPVSVNRSPGQPQHATLPHVLERAEAFNADDTHGWESTLTPGFS